MWRVYNQDLDFSGPGSEGWILENRSKREAITYVIESWLRSVECRRWIEPQEE